MKKPKLRIHRESLLSPDLVTRDGYPCSTLYLQDAEFDEFTVDLVQDYASKQSIYIQGRKILESYIAEIDKRLERLK